MKHISGTTSSNLSDAILEEASQLIYLSEALRIKLHDASPLQISNQTLEQKSQAHSVWQYTHC